MGAVLLAVAMVTIPKGLRSSNPRTQASVADVLLPTRRTTYVAPRTSSLRR